MYKAKFSEWGFTKIMRYSLSKKIVEAARVRGDRPTEAIVGDRVIPLSRVKESYERYSAKPGANHVQDTMTPPGLSSFILRTPGDTTLPATTIPSPAPITAAATAESSHIVWTPSHIVGQQAPEREPSRLRVDWRGMSLSQLRGLKRDAARLDAEGRKEEAEEAFASALSGFRHLLTPTHELTIKAAYQLAAFYASHNRMADADKVLHWISECHIRKWGAGHDRTLAHYLQVVLLLRGWSREEHAEVLVFRITEALQNGEDEEPEYAPQIPGTDEAHIQNAVDNLDEASVERIFMESEDESMVDAQLRIADLWVASGSVTMEGILTKLIAHCDGYGAKLSVQAVQARCKLIRFHILRNDTDKAREVSLDTRRALVRLVSDYSENGNIPETVLTLAREVAFLHLDNQDHANCEKVLSWFAEKLERQVGTDVVRQEPSGMAVVDFLVRTGGVYQQRSGWKDAAPWIEWAYGICLRTVGPNHEKTRDLETCIRDEHYEPLSRRMALTLLAPGVDDIVMRIL